MEATGWFSRGKLSPLKAQGPSFCPAISFISEFITSLSFSFLINENVKLTER